MLPPFRVTELRSDDRLAPYFSCSFPRSAWERSDGTLCVPSLSRWSCPRIRRRSKRFFTRGAERRPRPFPRGAWERGSRPRSVGLSSVRRPECPEARVGGHLVSDVPWCGRTARHVTPPGHIPSPL